MPAPIDPIRPTDDEARDLAQSLIAAARFAALAVLHPETRAPYVSRIALGRAPSGAPVTLVSTLALHTTALKADPREKYLAEHPKSKLYADFADFGFVLFEAEGAALNGGFGRAYMLTPEDLGLR
jgi:hypothetical protein